MAFLGSTICVFANTFILFFFFIAPHCQVIFLFTVHTRYSLHVSDTISLSYLLPQRPVQSSSRCSLFFSCMFWWFLTENGEDLWRAVGLSVPNPGPTSCLAMSVFTYASSSTPISQGLCSHFKAAFSALPHRVWVINISFCQQRPFKLTATMWTGTSSGNSLLTGLHSYRNKRCFMHVGLFNVVLVLLKSSPCYKIILQQKTLLFLPMKGFNLQYRAGTLRLYLDISCSGKLSTPTHTLIKFSF